MCVIPPSLHCILFKIKCTPPAAIYVGRGRMLAAICVDAASGSSLAPLTEAADSGRTRLPLRRRQANPQSTESSSSRRRSSPRRRRQGQLPRLLLSSSSFPPRGPLLLLRRDGEALSALLAYGLSSSSLLYTTPDFLLV